MVTNNGKQYLFRMLEELRLMPISMTSAGSYAAFIDLGILLWKTHPNGEKFQRGEISLYLPVRIQISDDENRPIFEGWPLEEQDKLLKESFLKKKIIKAELNKKDNSIIIQSETGTKLKSLWSERGEWWAMYDRRGRLVKSISIMKSGIKLVE